MNELQTLAYLTAIKMLMNLNVVSVSLVELQAIQQSYKMILDTLPVPKRRQIGLRYILWQVKLEIAAVERIIDVTVGYTKAFGGSVQKVKIVFGTLQK